MNIPGLQALKRDRFFHLLLITGVGLSVFVPFTPHTWPAAIDWRTIITLSGLMMLTKGLELSGYFDVLGRKMVRRFATERKLALFMVFSAALLSTFLTNDVALFIVVPLTLTLRKLCEIPVTRLIIFEALAVNAGSLLTPIGNPQNILLWGRSGLSFTAFTGQMAPLALAIVASLLAVGWFAFPNKSLQYHSGTTGPHWQPRLVWSCLGLYIVFLIALELNQALAGALLVACGFLFLARRVLVSVDWTLLLVFMAMFIDVHLLIQLPVLQNVLHSVSGLSQLISTVPSTILLLNYVPPTVLLAWAVNVGGFGLLPGSLANLIALRMANDRRIWWRFHLWSIPMLLWSAAVGFGLFLLI